MTIDRSFRSDSSGMLRFREKHDVFATENAAGTLRVRSLENALDTLWSSRVRYGVSQVSSITAQGRIGLPVHNAIRLNARAHNLTVSTRKETTPTAALVSCLAEAYERHWAEPLRCKSSMLRATGGHLPVNECPYMSLNSVCSRTV